MGRAAEREQEADPPAAPRPGGRKRRRAEPAEPEPEAAAVSGEEQQHAPEDEQREEGGAEEAPERERRKALLQKKAVKALEAAEKKGVVYMSRVPPHLKPQKLRHMLGQYGELGRLYLAPEDPGVRKRRKKLKGNTGKNFSEGWVEFLDKRVAKRVAAMLNGSPMGGKRRSAYHYDLWNLKYLPRFKWDHLTEEIAYQNAVRDQRMAAEISAAKRERDFYLSRVDRARASEARAARRQKQAEEAGASGDAPAAAQAAAAAPEAGAGPLQPKRKVLRTHGQRQAKPDAATDAAAPVLPPDLLVLLGGKQR